MTATARTTRHLLGFLVFCVVIVLSASNADAEVGWESVSVTGKDYVANWTSGTYWDDGFAALYLRQSGSDDTSTAGWFLYPLHRSSHDLIVEVMYHTDDNHWWYNARGGQVRVLRGQSGSASLQKVGDLPRQDGSVAVQTIYLPSDVLLESTVGSAPNDMGVRVIIDTKPYTDLVIISVKVWYAIPLRWLSVSSTPLQGVSIASSTGHGGTTFYGTLLDDLTPVRLEAPYYHGSGSSRKRFDRWVSDTGWSTTVRQISWTADADWDFTAHYVNDPDYYLTISPPGRDHWAAPIFNQTITVSANCNWTPSANRSWITITGGSSGSNNGTVTYALEGNSGPARSGAITVTGGGITRTFSITQEAPSLSISPSSHSVGPGALSNMDFLVSGNVQWTAVANNSWIQIVSGWHTGHANGTVKYNRSANNSGGNRTGTITVSGQGLSRTFTVYQSGHKIIRLTGDLAFENVGVGQNAKRTLTIHNDGDSALTVHGISYMSPGSFSGNWSGTIHPGNSQPVTVTFQPESVFSYSGELTVNCDSTSGSRQHPHSGTGVNIQTYTLTVRSTNPSSGVSITSSTGHGGTTQYTRTLAQNTSVSLTADEYHGSGASRKRFTHWTGHTAGQRTISLTMTGDMERTANYTDDPPPPGVTRFDISQPVIGTANKRWSFMTAWNLATGEQQVSPRWRNGIYTWEHSAEAHRQWIARFTYNEKTGRTSAMSWYYRQPHVQ